MSYGPLIEEGNPTSIPTVVSHTKSRVRLPTEAMAKYWKLCNLMEIVISPNLKSRELTCCHLISMPEWIRYSSASIYIHSGIRSHRYTSETILVLLCYVADDCTITRRKSETRAPCDTLKSHHRRRKTLNGPPRWYFRSRNNMLNAIKRNRASFSCMTHSRPIPSMHLFVWPPFTTHNGPLWVFGNFYM